MSTPNEFTASCQAAAKGLRRVPADLRRELSTEVKAQVAVPLAARIGAAATGPYARVLAAGTKARASADPTIVVGGARPRLTGGAGPRAVVFGVEWGGGADKRFAAVARTSKRAGHRRHTTNQFTRHKAPFIYPTVAANFPWVLDTFADLTLGVLGKAVNRG